MPVPSTSAVVDVDADADVPSSLAPPVEDSGAFGVGKDESALDVSWSAGHPTTNKETPSAACLMTWVTIASMYLKKPGLGWCRSVQRAVFDAPRQFGTCHDANVP